MAASETALTDAKILVTGLTGQIAWPMAVELAADNEVWGAARFSVEGSRERVETAGIVPVTVDLAAGDFSGLPDDFTHLLHFAAYQGADPDWDHAMAVNAEGTGLLMAHCRSATAALIASTFSIYEPHPDPWHVYTETSPLGEAHLMHSPTYSSTKIGQEAVARTMARALDLPTTIARINVAYSSHGGLPAYHLDWIMAGEPVRLRAPEPTPYSPIHQDDMNAHVPHLLAAATVPATIVNWCGDEVVTAEDWCTQLGEWAGRPVELVHHEAPGTQPGAAGDPERRRSITGPCRVSWREGMRELLDTRYPGGQLAEGVNSNAAALGSAFDD